MLWIKAVLVFTLGSLVSSRRIEKRSIDLIAAHGLITDTKLSQDLIALEYFVQIHPHIEKATFDGRVSVNFTVQDETNTVDLHSHPDLKILETTVRQITRSDEEVKNKVPNDGFPKTLEYSGSMREGNKPILSVVMKNKIKPGSVIELTMVYTGKIFNETSEGLFRSSYVEPESKTTQWFVATHLRPNMARNVFPCFDEPGQKAVFTIKIGRHRDMMASSNMPLDHCEPMENNPDYYWDIFKKSPPMPTYSVSFVISDFSSLKCVKVLPDNHTLTGYRIISDLDMTVWSRPNFINALVNVSAKVNKSIHILENFWARQFPLPKLDIFALPNYQATRPSDSWGLLIFKESELSGKGSWHITQELVYQWLGGLATPFWWSDAHINNALVRYVTAYTTLKMDENETFNNWPMTMLYSIYYEFSKRYPHGKSTAIKQDSTSAKTELIFRMLNYTLGEKTLNKGLQRFMSDREFKNFFGDDIWNSITEQAKLDKTLGQNMTVNDIAASWITKDRLPVVTVKRNYEAGTATLTQRVYLRERPHDLPDQEKFVWWVPIVLIKQSNLDFHNTRPNVWMKKEKEITIKDLPKHDQFIIVNPEEIGPFPVNYDVENWNLLATFLCSDQRKKIPVVTRAKLLHDAWNLAYAGDLSFATALNMTLFLKHERDYLAWDPVFTLIDHIGRHIDSTTVHKKFQNYVRILLTPLYEELGNEPQEGESEGKTHLRSSSKVFLCQAGYKPCIQEAQEAYKKWMEIDNPDEGNPVANQYICPVFKWGTDEEWNFGLQRVLQFPATRKQNERTYLLKTLAGCPNDASKIERLLNLTVLQKNEKFSDNDVYLIFNMLTGNANGYTALFNFLKNNWDEIKRQLEDKPHLWNSLITSATTAFKTQEGLDMVSELYVSRQSEFGPADFVVEKALKNIKEETKWSNENLPVIEKWLDDYLAKHKVTI